jgi:hypothetical protein
MDIVTYISTNRRMFQYSKTARKLVDVKISIITPNKLLSILSPQVINHQQSIMMALAIVAHTNIVLVDNQ